MAHTWKKQGLKKCSEWCWIVVLTFFMCLVLCCEGFNVDTVNFIRHSGAPGSMFGFSVAEHKERGKNWVLIGAPEAQTRQPGVTKGGSVFRCEVNRDDACEEILFDSTGNNNNTDGRQIDKKSEQWFGATVRSSGETGIVLACAPRYVWFSTTTAYRRDPVGTCYIAKNYFSEFSEYSPCRTRNWGYHRQGSCQAGLGADVSKDGNRLYVGAPGSWYWQGQIYDITSTFKMPTISPDYSKNHELNLIEYESGNKDNRKKSGNLSNKNNQHNQSNQHGGGQLYAQNPNKRPEVLATSEGSPQDDDSYLGYSVAAGDFEGRGEGGVAVGMPRGAGLFGKVVLYSVNLTNLQNLTGHQLGSYFSYSLAALDVDGDGLDDVIIGAPLYTDLNNNEGKYETGRVYVYYQEPRIDSEGYYTRFSKYDFRDGKNSKGRFGLSVAALGDMNKDGYGDFAVGAPYDGAEGRGAVYIYQGMKGGVRESYSQVIRAEDLSVPTSTFGFSIAGGLDMDDNQYPDMVVGAYESDTAIFFRSRPVVRMVDARVSFNSKNKQISLEEENCTLRDYTKVPCLYLQACLKYNGVEVDRQLDVDIGVALDSKKPKSPRMFFLNEEGKNIKNDTIRLTKGELNCKSYYVYVKPNIRDKLTPLEAELRYSVKDTSGSQVGLGRRYSRSLTPVLDANDMNIQKDSLSIQKNCGPDNICIPDLRVTTKKSVSKYLLGSGDRFTLDVQVENKGEDAFEAMYNLQVPPGMNYINIERLDSERSIPVQCSAPSPLTNNTLKCDIGNPLPKEKLVHFKVLLQPYHREGMKSSYNFVSAVNSTNPEDEFTAKDNVEAFTIPIWVETDLILQGSSIPPDIHYNMSHYKGDAIRHEMDIGPQVVHVYNIRNKGPSDIVEAQAIFLWPSYTLSGDHLLYLLEQPETNGNVKCEYVENVNEERIELDRKRKSYLDSSAFSAAQFSGHGYSKAGGRGGSRGREGGAAGAAAAGAAAAAAGAAAAGAGYGRGSGAGAGGGAGWGRGRGGGSFRGGSAGRGGEGGASWARGGAGGAAGAGGAGGTAAGGGGAAGAGGAGGAAAGGGGASGASGAGGAAFGGGGAEGGTSWSRGGGAGGTSWSRGGGGTGGSTGGARWESGSSGNIRWEDISWENLTEEEKRQLEEEVRRGGGGVIDYESGDGSLLHRTRIHGQSTSGRKYEGSGAGYGYGSGSGGGSFRSSSGSYSSESGYSESASDSGGRSGTRVSGGRRIIVSSDGRNEGRVSGERGGTRIITGGERGGVRVTSTGEEGDIRFRGGEGGAVRVASGGERGGVRVVSESDGSGVRVSAGERGGTRVISGGERGGVRVITSGGEGSSDAKFHVTGGNERSGGGRVISEGSGVRVISGGEGRSGAGGRVIVGGEGSEVRVLSGGDTRGSVSGGGVRISSAGGRIEGETGGSGVSWSEERSSSSSSSFEASSGSTRMSGSRGSSSSGGQGTFEEGTQRGQEGSVGGTRFDWEESQRSKAEGETSTSAKSKTQDERKIQQRPLVHNATGYSRARGKVETDMARNVSDSGIIRKAYGQNEFRTVALDLTPGQGSNIGVSIVGGKGEEISGNDIIGGDSESHGERTIITEGTRFGGSSTRTREYEEAINRELERRRQEAEEAAAAAAAAAAGLGVERKTETTDATSTDVQTGGSSATFESRGEGGASGGWGDTRTSSSSGSSGSTYTRQGEGSRTFTTSRNDSRTFHIHSGTSRGYESQGGGSYEENEAFNRENERRRLEAEAAAAAGRSSGAQGGTRTYQIHGSILGNGTRTYKILSNGTKVYETRYDEGGLDTHGEGTKSYEYEDAMNREYERRRQEAEAAAAAAAAAASRGSETYGGGYRTYETQGGASRNYGITGLDPRAHEEALRREYEIKRQEAEAAANELERIRLESEAGVSHGPGIQERIENLRREYEKKRLEAEAAAAAASAAASARSSAGSTSHHYNTEYHYRTNSTWGAEGRPRTDSSGRWYVNNNGTIQTGSTGYDADYLRQLQEEHERRLRNEAARRFEEEKSRGSNVQYFNNSYFSSSERRYDTRDRNIDPDLGYVRTRSAEEPEGTSGSRYYRTRQRSVSENFVDDDEEDDHHSRYKKSLERSKNHHTLLTRYKRQTVVNNVDLKSSLSCGPTNCTKIRCTVGPLKRGQEAWIAFRGRVWVDTLEKFGYQKEVMLSSLLASQVTKLPHIGEPHNAKVETYEVFSELMPQDVTVKPEVAPLWIIVLSACAGTLILLLLSFLLWKLGFFKRNRPSNAPEKQPLNRNGYHAGDEQL